MGEAQDPRVLPPGERNKQQLSWAGVPALMRQDRQRGLAMAVANGAERDVELAPDGRPWGDLAAMSAEFGMDEMTPFVHDAYFTRETRRPMPESEMSENVFYSGRGRRR
jgi:hypothetical protein